MAKKAGLWHDEVRWELGMFSLVIIAMGWFTALTGEFDNEGWPDAYVACDSTPGLLFHDNRDGAFGENRVPGGFAYNEDVRDSETRKYRRTRVLVMTWTQQQSSSPADLPLQRPHLGRTTRACFSPAAGEF